MRALYMIPGAAIAVLFLAGPGLAHEQDGRPEQENASLAETSRSPTALLYAKECGSCHLAYPPGLLPAASWQRTMASLEHHFGQNAELDRETGATLERWLTDHAAEASRLSGSHKVASLPGNEVPLRISQSPSFRSTHRKIDGRVLARQSVRSFANCGACHPGAKDWDFDDDRAKIPAR